MVAGNSRLMLLLLVLLLEIDEGYAQCSGSTLTLTASMTSLGEITSQNYPDIYANNENCAWEINADGSVLFYVAYKRLETANDFLKMFSGTQTGTVVYDSSRPRSYPTPYVQSSSGSQLTITFTSDASITFGGFRMYYMDIASPPSCGTTLTANSTAQQLSYIYRSQGSGCTWTITSPSLIEITVLMVQGQVHIEEGGVAEYITQIDAVIVTNISSVDVIGDYNKAFVIQYKEVSTGTDAPIVTTTTEPITDCRVGNTLTATSTIQYLQSPSYPGPYPNSASCSEVIQASDTQDSVYIEILDYELFLGDSVNIYDGPSNQYNVLDGLSTGKTFTSTGYNLFIQFTTDTYGQNRGFRLSYVTVARVTPTCGFYNYTLNATTSEQTFSSPNYPSNYNDNLDMYWLITKPNPDDGIVLHFKQFDLETSNGCWFDSVTVYDGSCTTDPVLAKLCGNGPSKYQDSTGLYILVGLKTDSTANENGFELTYYLEFGEDVPNTSAPSKPCPFENDIARTSSYDKPTEPGGLPAYAIALIVIAAVLVVVIIVVVVIVVIRMTNTLAVAAEPGKPLITRKRKNELWKNVYYMYSFKLNQPKEPKKRRKQQGVFHPAPNTEGEHIAVITTGDLNSHPPPSTLYNPPFGQPKNDNV